jgi:hypothetical protein
MRGTQRRSKGRNRGRSEATTDYAQQTGGSGYIIRELGGHPGESLLGSLLATHQFHCTGGTTESTLTSKCNRT